MCVCVCVCVCVWGRERYRGITMAVVKRAWSNERIPTTGFECSIARCWGGIRRTLSREYQKIFIIIWLIHLSWQKYLYIYCCCVYEIIFIVKFDCNKNRSRKLLCSLNNLNRKFKITLHTFVDFCIDRLLLYIVA